MMDSSKILTNVSNSRSLNKERNTTVSDVGEAKPPPGEMRNSSLVFRHLVAGAVAGCVSRTITAPLDCLKVYRQVYGAASGKTLMGDFQSIVKEGGFMSLWRGNGTNVLKISPETAIRFASYDQIKRMMFGDENTRNMQCHERAIAGALAGGMAQTVAYPLDVMKTHLILTKRSQYSGIADCAKQLFQREGVRAFYKGYTPNMLGIVPCAGTDLAVYETLKNAWLQNNKDDSDPGVMVLIGCGAVSSTCGQLVSYPLVLIRTRMQTQGSLKGTACLPMRDLFCEILSNEGVAGLYHGIVPNLLKAIPAACITYVVYEQMKKFLGI